MKRLLTACVSLVALAILPDTALATGVVQRYLLVAGANYGGPDRPRLQYAVSDAERFARVLVDLGGVPPANEIVLKEPKLRDFQQALDQLSARVAEGRRAASGNGGGRIEVLLYYSGHADEKGLLLGEDRYSYATLRDRLDQIPADVRIAVLDACASGAFIRIKGGKTRPHVRRERRPCRRLLGQARRTVQKRYRKRCRRRRRRRSRWPRSRGRLGCRCHASN